MKTILSVIAVVVVVLGLAFWLFKSSKVEPQNLPGTAYEILGAEHIPEGSTDHPPYNSNPPTSGWHWPKPAPWGYYATEQPDEQIIHNLEHGGVWIAYKPDLPEDQVNLLKDFSRRYRKVVIAPRSANDSNIALAAWGRLQKLDSYNESEILKFIEAFYDKGPEKAD